MQVKGLENDTYENSNFSHWAQRFKASFLKNKNAVNKIIKKQIWMMGGRIMFFPVLSPVLFYDKGTLRQLIQQTLLQWDAQSIPGKFAWSWQPNSNLSQ